MFNIKEDRLAVQNSIPAILVFKYVHFCSVEFERSLLPVWFN